MRHHREGHSVGVTKILDPTLEWFDPGWQEPSDNAWQRTLRWQQGWWREEILKAPAGPRTLTDNDRLVVSMLPDGPHPDGKGEWSPNLMTEEANEAATKAIHDLKTERRPGLIQTDRLRRNLLSSQPLCFNLFGYLAAYPKVLLPWIHSVAPGAEYVTEVRLEWAPRGEVVAGSAFDAFIVYLTNDGKQGFVGVECKYAENLAKAQPSRAADKFADATNTPAWRLGAAQRLDVPKLRQFWYNQLLTQQMQNSTAYAEGTGVVLACAGDHPARDAVTAVRAELANEADLRFGTIEDLVAGVVGHDAWRDQFAERYLTYPDAETRVRDRRNQVAR